MLQDNWNQISNKNICVKIKYTGRGLIPLPQPTLRGRSHGFTYKISQKSLAAENV